MDDPDKSPPDAQNPLKNAAPPPDFYQMRQALAEGLAASTAGEDDMLRRQAEALDALFHFTLSKGVGTQHFHAKPQPHYIHADMLALALRVQQQCVATLRSTRTMDYMNALQEHNLKKLPPRPPPHEEGGDTPTPNKNNERKGLGENVT